MTGAQVTNVLQESTCLQENMSGTLRTALVFCSSRISECLSMLPSHLGIPPGNLWNHMYPSAQASWRAYTCLVYQHCDSHSGQHQTASFTRSSNLQTLLWTKHSVLSFWNPHSSFNNQFYPHPLQMLPESDLSHRDSGLPLQFSFPCL